MEIKKAFLETVPASKLIGKRYTDKDCVNGSFVHKWGEFFRGGWFDKLEKAGGKADFDYLGVMRVTDGGFEYWIGMLANPDTVTPEGFDGTEIPETNFAVFWTYGSEANGELFGYEPHQKCMELLKEKGWKRSEDNWCIERYNCPRYTSPDENGNVILDYYIAVE